MTAKYDLLLNNNSNFDFWAQYMTDDGLGINLAGYDVKFEVKRYKGDPNPVLMANPQGLTYGYTAGMTSGVRGVGGISMNRYYDLTTVTGGMFINIGSETTKNLPYGNHFYDLTITGNNISQKILEGRLRINP